MLDESERPSCRPSEPIDEKIELQTLVAQFNVLRCTSAYTQKTNYVYRN